VAIPDEPIGFDAGDPAQIIAEIPIPGPAGHRRLAEVLDSEQRAAISEPAPSSNESPALRDAQSIAARIAADEAAADEARQTYQAEGLPAIEPDAAASAILGAEELLHAVRASALLEEPVSGEGGGLPRGGTLYLTSARLVHLGTETTELPLAEIDEIAVALERLVLIRHRDGSDWALEVDQPRLLRVQLSTAIAARRAGTPP
jgi:hypothetical protein